MNQDRQAPAPPPNPVKIGDMCFAFLTARKPSEDMEAYIARDWRHRRYNVERNNLPCGRTSAQKIVPNQIKAAADRADIQNRIVQILRDGREHTALEMAKIIDKPIQHVRAAAQRLVMVGAIVKVPGTGSGHVTARYEHLCADDIRRGKRFPANMRVDATC